MYFIQKREEGVFKMLSIIMTLQKTSGRKYLEGYDFTFDKGI